MRTLIFLIITIFVFQSISAQNKYYTKSKKAAKHFEKALQNYNLQYFQIAENELDEALKIDADFLDVYILKAQIEIEKGNKEKAIENFEKALKIDETYQSLIFLKKAEIELETGKYIQAKSDFVKYKSIKKLSENQENYLKKKIMQCEFAISAINNPVNFKPINIGSEINSELSEYWPSLTADNQIITFTVSNRKTNSQEDLFVSEKVKNKWEKAKNLEYPINTEKSEGAQSISADGKTMVFTACLRDDTYGSCDIYISKKDGNNWTKPENIGSPINSKYKETQPCLSADGKTIYFVSNRQGGKGKFDIWQSSLNQNNEWTTPINLGDSINTEEDELAPFIHYDDKTLYFSSKGHLGMGGSDIFISRKGNNNLWSKAVNFGYPANTYFNEESLVVTTDGQYGFFSSDIEGGFGQKDIYYFEMPNINKPEKFIYAKGIVYDITDNKRINAEIDFSNLDDSTQINTYSDEITGEFLVCLSPNNNYAVNVFKNGYLPYSEQIEMPDTNLFLNIPLNPIKNNDVFVLKNIFFKTDSFNLEKKSFIELKKLSEFLKINPNIKIEIQGHTDNKGTKKYNYILSEKRALSVYKYLINSTINKNRLLYKGFGYDMPIAPNTTDEGRSKNRRTAFKIIL
ncbi:MAG: PD40 domain-containing protein [Bacteroidales bacterium]|nr:PD40 domain-containing protein [Bacteroidales bacterium]MBN2757591.1 PD40 domain-containing protein [Bacteroidales bacterium]